MPTTATYNTDAYVKQMYQLQSPIHVAANRFNSFFLNRAHGFTHNDPITFKWSQLPKVDTGEILSSGTL